MQLIEINACTSSGNPITLERLNNYTFKIRKQTVENVFVTTIMIDDRDHHMTYIGERNGIPKRPWEMWIKWLRNHETLIAGVIIKLNKQAK